jgi:predicted transcriptional regulator
MRAKKQQSLAPANITEAWQRVFEDTRVDDIERLESEGWRNIYEIAEQSGRPRNTICHILDSQVKEGLFEKKIAKVVFGTQVRKVSFYRPVVK